jgi:hypothetical protein
VDRCLRRRLLISTKNLNRTQRIDCIHIVPMYVFIIGELQLAGYDVLPGGSSVMAKGEQDYRKHWWMAKVISKGGRRGGAMLNSGRLTTE